MCKHISGRDNILHKAELKIARLFHICLLIYYHLLSAKLFLLEIWSETKKGIKNIKALNII
jgi:hypothetical protein